VFDNPKLVVACVVGDGETETGPLATAGHSNKFRNPATDGAILPILHLNDYREEGPITTPFDMTVLNDLDRFRFIQIK
jgi:xylulose-5-phosphate/fructose-6-phosphate phosphoketolase